RADPDYPHEPELPPNVSIADAAAQAGLNEIARADAEFHVAKFAGAAQDAFALIVEAFADGDRALLKDLLEPQVYAAFDAAIVEREERGEFMSNQIHAVKKAEILMARLDGRTAYVTFRFIAQESCVIRGKDGDILSGNPDRVTEMNDIWTFTRHVSSNDPKWYLHRTQDGDVVEAHKTPVPDMK
ncbi:MAG: Tim44/TimA family putative adaptor protein, partial [Micavibrio sp.]